VSEIAHGVSYCDCWCRRRSLVEEESSTYVGWTDPMERVNYVLETDLCRRSNELVKLDVAIVVSLALFEEFASTRGHLFRGMREMSANG